jgi:hypothetical protein
MHEPDLLSDIHFLRDVVARTQPPDVNPYWPVSLSWGCVITLGYAICAALGISGKLALIPWVMPILIFLIALPLSWYLRRRVRKKIEDSGVHPRSRKDLIVCWLSISAVGILWSAGLGLSGQLAGHWYLVVFIWGSLYFVGYTMNGVLLSTEWFWAAAAIMATLLVAFVAGPRFYWLPGFWIGGTLILAGVLGRRNARRRLLAA